MGQSDSGAAHMFRAELSEVSTVRLGEPADHLLIDSWREGEEPQADQALSSARQLLELLAPALLGVRAHLGGYGPLVISTRVPPSCAWNSMRESIGSSIPCSGIGSCRRTSSSGGGDLEDLLAHGERRSGPRVDHREVVAAAGAQLDDDRVDRRLEPVAGPTTARPAPGRPTPARPARAERRTCGRSRSGGRSAWRNQASACPFVGGSRGGRRAGPSGPPTAPGRAPSTRSRPSAARPAACSAGTGRRGRG